MYLNFDEMEEKVLPEFKGGAGALIAKMHSDDLGKIMFGKLEPGSEIGFHAHETNSEIIFILSGTGDLLYDDTTETVPAGGCHYCPKGHSHSLRNHGDEDLIFYAVVPEQ